MKQILSRVSTVLNDRHIPWIAGLSGILLASFMIHARSGVINSDGILYIEVARQVLAGNWSEVRHLFAWPLYPVLIACVNVLTGLSLQAAAHLLTGIFFGLSAAGISLLVREMGGNRNTMLAAVLLLLASPYLARSLLPMVIRDHGFLAAHIWSLIYFVRFYRNAQNKDAWLWGGCATLATLFRIEGMTYLLLLPIILWMEPKPWRDRLGKFIKVNQLLPALGGLLAGYLLLNPSTKLTDFGRLSDPLEFAKRALFQMQHGLSEKAVIYGNQVLGEFLDDFALAGLIVTLFLILVYKSLTCAGWVQLIVAIFFRKHRGKMGHSTTILSWSLMLGTINAIFILLSSFVLSGRYLLSVALVIILYGAFGLEHLYRNWRGSLNTNWALWAVLSGLLLQAVFILAPPSKGSKFEIEAAQWASRHLPKQSLVYFDHGRLQFYFNGISNSREETSFHDVLKIIRSSKIKAYEYALLHIPLKEPNAETTVSALLGKPLARFPNRNEEVAIYQIPKPSSSATPPTK